MRFAERATTADYPLNLLRDQFDPRLIAVGSTVRFRSHSGACADESCSRVATVVAGVEYDEKREVVFVTVVYPLERFPLEQKRLTVATRNAWGTWQLALRSAVAVVIPTRQVAPEPAEDAIPEAS